MGEVGCRDGIGQKRCWNPPGVVGKAWEWEVGNGKAMPAGLGGQFSPSTHGLSSALTCQSFPYFHES